MAFPYGRTEHYSPLSGDQQPMYASPAAIQQPWSSNYGDLGSPEIEMHGQPRPHPPHRQSQNSLASVQSHSTLFPSNQTTPGALETQSFLHDPSNKIDTSFATSEYQPFKDKTARQLRHLLIGSSTRFLITAALCAGYILATIVWCKKKAISENQKKVYNTITTALSLALGLNIASAFKDMALNMRWPILAARKRNLRELDSFLRADSLTELFKLVFIAKRFWVIIACLAWLLINILAQAGIAMLSLTYGFDVNYDAVLLSPGTIRIPDMSHFFPSTNNSAVPSLGDEQYTAHSYGGLSYELYGVGNITTKPKAGDIWKDKNDMLFWDEPNQLLEYTFRDAPMQEEAAGIFAAYSERTITVDYSCRSSEVTKNGNGSFNTIETADYGSVDVASVVPDSTTYFTSYKRIDGKNIAYNQCDEDHPRCAIVQVFEASTTDTPYYYFCNITIGSTQNDQDNISFVPDTQAFWAANAIAQIGYVDTAGEQQYSIYPSQSSWGVPGQGDANYMGQRIATFALGSIAGASLMNPTKTHNGNAPQQAFQLTLNHSFYFYLIIGLICGCQLLFCIVVSILANRVKVGPEGHLSMSLLMRPIADALEGVSGGRENKAYENATKQYNVRYEKSRNGRWILAMS